ncbi:MAG: PorV/PorQ family protein [candidate division WOR-3 bacterium]|nr:PorV/PorQ family protein [candidate division WOR-3 bacterium]
MGIIVFLFSVFSQSDIGTTMYPLLKICVGPRPVAMGETFVGLADDITSLYWNPAGLSGIKDLRFFVSHHEWFQDIRDEFIIFGMPGLGGYMTMSGVYSSNKDVEIWDENNNSLGTGNTWSGIFTIGYGRNLRERLCYGLAIKTMVEDLYEQSFYDFAFDIGGKIILKKDMQFGCSIKNLSYNTDIPSEIKIGCAYQKIKNLNILLDLNLPMDNIVRANFGFEYNLNPIFSLRGGWRSGPYHISELGFLSGFTSGFGIKYSGIVFDYAFVPYGKLGLTHRLSVSSSLGIGKPTNLLRISVIDGDTREPLIANINLAGIKQGSFQTDKSGKIEFKNIGSGGLIISAFVAGYPQIMDSIFVEPEGKTEKIIILFKTKFGILRGMVFDAVTKKPIGATILYKGNAYGIVDNDSVSGSFVLRNLPAGVYFLTVSGKDSRYIAQTCSLTIEPGKLTEKEIYLIKKREKIVLKGINFDTGKADLKPEFLPFLDEAGKILLDNPDIKVELSGHTDPREINTAEFPSNWELSFARAEAVRKYLIEKFNIAPERLIARGYADTQPIAPNDTEEGMAKNRRTEFRILEE